MAIIFTLFYAFHNSNVNTILAILLETCAQWLNMLFEKDIKSKCTLVCLKALKNNTIYLNELRVGEIKYVNTMVDDVLYKGNFFL